jgi:O-antigen ligase
LILFSLGTILLAITFSRSAWLGYATFLAILTLKAKHIDRKRLTLFITATILTLTLTFLPLRQVVEARTTSTVSHAEEFSFIGRAWLTQEAIQMIRERPLTGYGIGSFITELSKRAGEGYIIEPVHNIFLLAGAELGLPGILFLIGLSVVIAICIVKVKTPQAILASGILSGLGIISLFDHYLWTLAPGRVLLALVFGLWLGTIENDA